ncbi:hypothetical protein RBB50_000582 [Rhinocladiella similis]
MKRDEGGLLLITPWNLRIVSENGTRRHTVLQTHETFPFRMRTCLQDWRVKIHRHTTSKGPWLVQELLWLAVTGVSDEEGVLPGVDTAPSMLAALSTLHIPLDVGWVCSSSSGKDGTCNPVPGACFDLIGRRTR